MKIGPFTYSEQQGNSGHCFVAQIWNEDGTCAAEIEPTDDPAAANAIAKQFAAAPELLEELRNIINDGSLIHDYNWHMRAEAAIRKATTSPSRFVPDA